MMNTEKERVSYLFNRYYEKTASDSERKELFLLLKGLSKEELSELVSDAYYNLDINSLISDDEKANSELNKILTTSKSEEEDQTDEEASESVIVPLWRRVAVAASIIFVLGIGIYFYKSNTVTQPVQVAKTDTLKDALPGSNRATLTLGDGSTIILDDAGNGLLAKQGNIEVSKTNNGQLIYAIKSNSTNPGAVQINTISTPRGGQYQVILPDGTRVWLNAASSIRFPTAFVSNQRKVDVSGEVYFEVTKMKKPFIVQSEKASIQVLGTHFNIMAYDDEDVMKTTLLEGSVKILSGNASQLLVPGQQAQLQSKGEIKVAEVDVDEAIAWKTGLFQFDDAGIEAVMRQISRWYDVEVKYEGNMPQKQITGRISRNVNASEVLSMLSYTGINFKIEGKKIIVIP